MKIKVLGCGSSGGVPSIGCNCATCQSNNPKNIRTRVSLYIEVNGLHLLVDTSPDFRQQSLRENIKKIDAVLYTHAHADHVHGMDDIRSFNYLNDDTIPVYSNTATIEQLKSRFAYAFGPKPQNGVWYRPSLVAHELPEVPVQQFSIRNTSITAFEQQHGRSKTLGFRIGDFAYSTDVETLPESAFEALKGVQVWVVDCLRYSPSPSHSHLAKTLEWIERVQPKQAILTHMAHDLEYDKLKSELPAGVEPAYDGMILEL